MGQIIDQNEMKQLPYASLSTALRRAHQNTPAFREVNKILFRELREISRQQDNFLMKFSKLVSHRTDEYGNLANPLSSIPADAFDHYFEIAVAGVHEYGRKASEAQVRALESLRAHAHSAFERRRNKGVYI